MLCDDLEGWEEDVGGRIKEEEIYAYLWLIHTVVQQKLTQHFKAIILQLKKKEYPKVIKRKITEIKLNPKFSKLT